MAEHPPHPHLTKAAVGLVVLALSSTGCGSSDPQTSASETQTTSETIETPYGTTPISVATAAWRAAINEAFVASSSIVHVNCGRSLADDWHSIDPNCFECGADLKDSAGSVFLQDGSVLCQPKCVAHVGVGRDAYDD